MNESSYPELFTYSQCLERLKVAGMPYSIEKFELNFPYNLAGELTKHKSSFLSQVTTLRQSLSKKIEIEIPAFRIRDKFSLKDDFIEFYINGALVFYGPIDQEAGPITSILEIIETAIIAYSAQLSQAPPINEPPSKSS